MRAVADQANNSAGSARGWAGLTEQVGQSGSGGTRAAAASAAVSIYGPPHRSYRAAASYAAAAGVGERAPPLSLLPSSPSAPLGKPGEKTQGCAWHPFPCWVRRCGGPSLRNKRRGYRCSARKRRQCNHSSWHDGPQPQSCGHVSDHRVGKDKKKRKKDSAAPRTIPRIPDFGRRVLRSIRKTGKSHREIEWPRLTALGHCFLSRVAIRISTEI